MDYPSIHQMDLSNQTVLVRVDFNVPMKNGQVTDTTRIDETLPTLRALIQKNCKIILMSHLGSPKGKIDSSLSLLPVAKILQQKIGKNVLFSNQIVGEETAALIHQLHPQELLLLENLRFNPAEETPSLDPDFAKNLAKLGSYYINDAFGCAHRNHSSIVPICSFFPKKCLIGLLMQKEVKALNTLYFNPRKPFLAIIGGAKIQSKIKVISSLIEKADALFIGGGMATPFLQAKGFTLYSELSDESTVELAKSILLLAEKKKTTLHLPEDLVIADKIDKNAKSQIISVKEGCKKPFTPVDIGPKTIDQFKKILPVYQTIFWNGPVGVFEIPPFDQGTNEIAKAIGKQTCDKIVGGGDSVAAIQTLGLKEQFTHVSTGGGASIEFLENGTLPGLEAIKQNS
jgi:phosphoglycerate kinase